MEKIFQNILQGILGGEENKLQLDYKIPDSETTVVLDTITTTEKTSDSVKVLLDFNCSEELTVNDVSIEGMKIDGQIKQERTNNGKLRLTIVVKPELYYDNYEISRINYTYNGETKEQEIKAKLSAQFYKTVNQSNWQDVFKDGYISDQNYLVDGDIDFSKFESPKINIHVARMVGIESNGKKPIVKNLTITNNITTNNSGLIRYARKEISGIDFENISITNTAGGNNVGVIGQTSGKILNCNFTSITINAPNSTYVGCIGYEGGSVSGTINLNNITNSGNYYVGGFAGYIGSSVSGTITLNNINCTAKKNNNDGQSKVGSFAGQIAGSNTAIYNLNTCDITASGDYVGGLIGSQNGTGKNTITAKNIKVKGNNRVGGIFGYGYAISKIIINDSNQEERGTNTVTGRNYVGGIGGEIFGSFNSDEKLIDDVIVLGSGESIGGIVGYYNASGADISKCIVNNSEVKGTSETSNNVGGIVGRYLGKNIYNTLVNNTVITSPNGSNIGGIAGLSGLAEGHINESFVQNTIITGKSNVGGITGKHKKGIIRDNYVDANITATSNYAGGIVGILENDTMTAISNVSRIYRNLVISSQITAKTSGAGGIIGKANVELYADVDFYYNNVVEAEINAESVNATASTMVGEAREINNSHIKNTYIHNATKINGTNINNQNDVIIDGQHKIVNKNTLKTKTTYTTNLGFSESYWVFSKLTDSKYPIIKIISASRQPGITIAEDPTTTMSLRGQQSISSVEEEVEELPEVEAYLISAYELNIEFTKKQENAAFTIYNSDTGEMILPDTLIENRTYTIEYDYKTPITIRWYNISEEKELEIIPEKIKNSITILGEEYCYLEGNTLKTNIRTIEGEFVNLYGKYALTSNAEVYNIETSNIEKSINIGVKETKPWMEFTYGENIIKTYANYSQIINGENIVERTQQIIIKNGKISLLDSSLEKNLQGIIIDNYNGGEYQTILGNDGVLYDLKQKIKYPEDFKNQKIAEMTNNIKNNHQKIMLRYETGRVYVFDYIEGKVLYDNYEKGDMSFLEYIKDKLNTGTEIITDTTNTYEDSRLLADKLTDTPISIAMSKLNIEEQQENLIENSVVVNNSANTTMQNNEYITAYNSNKKSFVVYSTADILNVKEETVETQNSKIETRKELIDYYYQGAKTYKSTKNNGVIYVSISLIAVIIILGIFYKRKS